MRQKEVHQVAAANEQQAERCAQQHDQRFPRDTGNIPAQRRYTESHVFVLLGILPSQPRRDDIHLGLRLFQGDTRFEPRHGEKAKAGPGLKGFRVDR